MAERTIKDHPTRKSAIMSPLYRVVDIQICPACNEAGCYACDYLGGWIPGWYVWNNRHGPYETQADAMTALSAYAK